MQSVNHGRGTQSRMPTALRRMETAANGSWGDVRLPIDVQKRRVAAVIERELTARQRQCLLEYLAGKTQREIARQLGLNPSTVCRTIERAINRLQRFLRY